MMTSPDYHRTKYDLHRAHKDTPPWLRTRTAINYWQQTGRRRYRVFTERLRPPSFPEIPHDTFANGSSPLFGDSRGRISGKGTSGAEYCRSPAIEEFPRDFMTPGQRSRGGVFAHVFIGSYMLLMVAIVAQDYFVPALEGISSALAISPDVAGATFMAAGSSAPEFFTNVIGTFVTKGDLGVGTVVGSAVFNMLGVTAAIGMVTGGRQQKIPIDYWALSRDTFFHLLAVILLIAVMYDGMITLVEAVFFILPYVIYILVMKFDRQINRAMRSWLHRRKGGGWFAENHRAVQEALRLAQEKAEEERVQGGYWDVLTEPPKGFFKKLFWIVSWPALLVLRLTVPDCTQSRWRKWFPATFIISIIWIAVLTYIIAWMITVIGHTIGVPDSVMGLTFLAAGTSVPELASSLLVARKGMGTMSVSNLLGSNTFDILVCLGIPWLIKGFVSGKVLIESGGLTYSVITLLFVIVLMYIGLVANWFHISRAVALWCLALYAVFLVVALLLEFNVFGVFNLPTCPTEA